MEKIIEDAVQPRGVKRRKRNATKSGWFAAWWVVYICGLGR